MDLLRIAGAAKAHVLVIAVDTPEQSLKIASQVRKHFPNLEIVARTRDLNHWFQLRDLGVEHAQREVFESSLISAQSVLELLGQSPAEAKRITARFREHNLALAERMYPHYKDKNQLIAVAKQGRQQLVEQMAKERADLLAGNAEAGYRPGQRARPQSG
jgi:glutathione-regulated potassium-efflux system ancillary protein KefC